MHMEVVEWSARLARKRAFRVRRLLAQQNIYYENTLALNRVASSRVKTVNKYSRTFISLLQLTTNQITPLAFTLENQNHSSLAPTLETLLES